MKQPKDPPQLPKPTRNTCKIANKFMTVASGEINLQRKHNLICHVAKVKAATSAHSMADIMPYFSVFNIPFESKASIRPKENYFKHNREKKIRNIFSTLIFQQFLTNKHHRLGDPNSRSRFGLLEVWVWSLTKNTTTNNKSCAEQEPRSAHGRTVNKSGSWCLYLHERCSLVDD